MKHALVRIAALVAAATAVAPALADHPLSFRRIESEQPRDPLTSNFVVYTDVHRSSADQLEPAVATLRAAIPAGTPMAEANAILQKAGARCTAAAGTDTCTYRGIQTVDEYMDEVKWTVSMNTADDRITSLDVTRDWRRH